MYFHIVSFICVLADQLARYPEYFVAKVTGDLHFTWLEFYITVKPKAKTNFRFSSEVHTLLKNPVRAQ
jgi:hypothetical protein